MRKREDTALNAFVIGFGNNSMSLLAGIMVLCTVFSVMPDAAGTIVGAGNEGLTFIWVPQLFAQIPWGQFFMAIFFLALVFAAWTSLVSMIELASRILQDMGLTRGRAIGIVGVAGLLCGVPSALNMAVFQNQDWVWGVGLMLSGFFFAVAVLKYGVTEWREKFINTGYSDIRVGAGGTGPFVWWWWRPWSSSSGWFVQVRGRRLGGRPHPLLHLNIGTVLIQWAVVLVILLLVNRFLVGHNGCGSGRGWVARVGPGLWRTASLSRWISWSSTPSAR